MNTIKVRPDLNPPPPLPGDLFQSRGDGDVYFLAEFYDNGAKCFRFLAIALKDGSRWGDPCTTAEQAVRGLTFLGRDTKISINPVTDAEPSTPANTRAQSPRSV